MRPCDHEIGILRECAGEKKCRDWGAAVGAALESLRGSGYLDEENQPTERGRLLLVEVASQRRWQWFQAGVLLVLAGVMLGSILLTQGIWPFDI